MKKEYYEPICNIEYVNDIDVITTSQNYSYDDSDGIMEDNNPFVWDWTK